MRLPAWELVWMKRKTARNDKYQELPSRNKKRKKLYTSIIFLMRLLFSKRKTKPRLLTAYLLSPRKSHTYQHTRSLDFTSCSFFLVLRFSSIACSTRQLRQ